jgi:hypothetical protein
MYGVRNRSPESWIDFSGVITPKAAFMEQPKNPPHKIDCSLLTAPARQISPESKSKLVSFLRLDSCTT